MNLYWNPSILLTLGHLSSLIFLLKKKRYILETIYIKKRGLAKEHPSTLLSMKDQVLQLSKYSSQNRCQYLP